MAIDPKELRIGSHVNANGVRARVIDIHNKTLSPDCKYQIFVEGISPEDGERKVVGSYADGLDPILITEELLSEIGFVNTSSTSRIVYTKGCEYDGMWAEVRTLKDRWEVFVSDNDWDGRIVVRYLHELEAFLYLTTKQELIKD